MISDLYEPLYRPNTTNGSKQNYTKVSATQETKADPSIELNKKLDELPAPRTAVQRLKDAAQMEEIRKLCGVIWLSCELHILFADTGVGKSIIAVAIANALSKGEQFLGLTNECEPLRVLLYDFELSDKQVEKRYSHELTGDSYIFDPNFFFDTIDFIELDEVDQNGNIDDLLFAKFRHDITRLNIQVLIIDNITYLNQYTTQKTEAALNLMRRLVKLKREFNLSILVLAHTPKINPSEPITINHLAGSKQIANFADSVSALGRSVQDKNMRYWKQVKPSRSAELIFDSEHVICCELIKEDEKFLTYQLLDYNCEREHLSRLGDEARKSKIELARELQQSGKTLAQIAEELLGDPKLKGTVSKWLNKSE